MEILGENLNKWKEPAPVEPQLDENGEPIPAENPLGDYFSQASTKEVIGEAQYVGVLFSAAYAP